MTEKEKQMLIERIQALCVQKGIAPTTAYTDSGVGKNFKSNLKNSNPSKGKLTMLANYFDVSVDYLLGKSDEIKKPTDIDSGELEDNTIIFHRDGKTQTRHFTDEQMDMFIAMADAIPEKPKDDI